MKATTTFSLKDQLFNEVKVTYLAELFHAVYPQFPADDFVKAVVDAFPELELKQRITHITEQLNVYLPDDYSDALEIILQALPPELDPSKKDDDFGEFIIAPLSNYVALYGCEAEYLEMSLNALKAITKRFSAEDAIRYFINAFPDETFAFLKTCALDANYHVRRLASEGSRPKLPWAQKLVTEYVWPLELLDLLYADSTRYVTRSVANHLNDISKLDPELVLATLKRWQAEDKQDVKEMAFICKHALRTLIKQGHQEALGLIGFGEAPDISISDLTTTTPDVIVGDAFEFAFTLTSHKQQNLVVDYLMVFASDSKKRSQKVFKIKQLELAKGKVVKLSKRHPMRLMTTRRLYEGEHSITLQVNGQAYGSLSFNLHEA